MTLPKWLLIEPLQNFHGVDLFYVFSGQKEAWSTSF